MASARRLQASFTRWTSVGVRALGQQRAVGGKRLLESVVDYLARSHSGRRWCSTNTLATAGRHSLLSCVEEEISLEQQLVQDLPEVTGFTATTTGCLATLQHNRERVTVELDAHHVVEVLPDELVQDEEEEEEPFFVPTFTISITNSVGSRLQVECSFDEHGQYSERGNEWQNLNINSVSVVPADCKAPDSVYTITAENLSVDMYDSLLQYLKTRGIDPKFAHDIFQFYRVHEHRCYLMYGLKALQNFLNTT